MIGFSSLPNEEWMLARRLVEACRDGEIPRNFEISLVAGDNRLLAVMVYDGNFDLRPQDYDLLRKLEDRDLIEIGAVASIANNRLIQLKDSLLAVVQDSV
jgi:hypothetical protein